MIFTLQGFGTGLAYFSSPNAGTYLNPSSERTLLRTLYAGQSGVYLWTNTLTGSQYVGISNDLGSRLIDYFLNSYLLKQLPRGSIISRALLKYGMAVFTLQVLVTGPSLPNTMPKTPEACPYLALEQYYLDTYACAYNVNLTATLSAYSGPTGVPLNQGEANASFGLTSTNAFAWGLSHSPSDILSFSLARGVTALFVYALSTLSLLMSFHSGVAFSTWANGSKRLGSDVHASVLASVVQAVLFESVFIVTAVPMTPEQLKLILHALPVFNVPAPRLHLPGATAIYGKQVSTGILRDWPSQEACTYELTGRRFVNKATMKLRLDKGLEYKGYLLQTKPF